MRIALAIALAAFCLLINSTHAQGAESAWKFVKAADYDDPKGSAPLPPVASLSLRGDTLVLPGNCSVHLDRKPYYSGGPFQMLLKSGETDAAISRFMKASLAFDLGGEKAYFEAADSDCNKLGTHFLMNASQLIAIHGSELFYAFSRQGDNVGASKATDAAPTLKTSPLPFSMAEYSSRCSPAMVKGVPQPSDKCAPAYNYHVASRSSTDALSKLVGAHDYQKGGAGAADDDYADPVKHNLHPVFLVFPPMGDVTVVRVDDFEGHQEQREQISGAFLAIKDGKVTDELNTGCELDARFVCLTRDGRKFRLTPSGKFEPAQ